MRPSISTTSYASTATCQSIQLPSPQPRPWLPFSRFFCPFAPFRVFRPCWVYTRRCGRTSTTRPPLGLVVRSPDQRRDQMDQSWLNWICSYICGIADDVLRDLYYVYASSDATHLRQVVPA